MPQSKYHIIHRHHWVLNKLKWSFSLLMTIPFKKNKICLSPLDISIPSKKEKICLSPLDNVQHYGSPSYREKKTRSNTRNEHFPHISWILVYFNFSHCLYRFLNTMSMQSHNSPRISIISQAWWRNVHKIKEMSDIVIHYSFSLCNYSFY